MKPFIWIKTECPIHVNRLYLILISIKTIQHRMVLFILIELTCPDSSINSIKKALSLLFPILKSPFAYGFKHLLKKY